MSDCCDADHGHVRLQDRRQQVALRDDLLVDEVEVVADVAEVLPDRGRHVEQVAARERRDRHEQRVHGAVEVAHLAAQQVDPLDRRDAAGEDRLLDLLDVALELLDDRRVVVDDLVEDRPQRRQRPLAQQLRPLLQPQPRGVQVARRALADGDDEARRRGRSRSRRTRPPRARARSAPCAARRTRCPRRTARPSAAGGSSARPRRRARAGRRSPASTRARRARGRPCRARRSPGRDRRSRRRPRGASALRAGGARRGSERSRRSSRARTHRTPGGSGTARGTVRPLGRGRTAALEGWAPVAPVATAGSAAASGALRPPAMTAHTGRQRCTPRRFAGLCGVDGDIRLQRCTGRSHGRACGVDRRHGIPCSMPAVDVRRARCERMLRRA